MLQVHANNYSFDFHNNYTSVLDLFTNRVVFLVILASVIFESFLQAHVERRKNKRSRNSKLVTTVSIFNFYKVVYYAKYPSFIKHLSIMGILSRQLCGVLAVATPLAVFALRMEDSTLGSTGNAVVDVEGDVFK